MKIVMHSLEQIAGVEIYPIIALIIFFVFFMLVAYMVISAPKEYIEEMRHLPLDKHEDLHTDNKSLK